MENHVLLLYVLLFNFLFIFYPLICDTVKKKNLQSSIYINFIQALVD